MKNRFVAFLVLRRMALGAGVAGAIGIHRCAAIACLYTSELDQVIILGGGSTHKEESG